MPKRLCSTLKRALRCRRPLHLSRSPLRFALPALATATGTLTILAVTLQLNPHHSSAPPPSSPNRAVAQGRLMTYGVAPGAAGRAERGASSRGGARSEASPSPEPSPSPSPTLTSSPSPTPSPTLTPTPAPTSTPVPTPEPLRPVTYVVAEGDTVAGLAERFGISEETILWANDLSEGEALQAGQELTILPVSGVPHTVEQGDTLHDIAQTYGVDSQTIVEANALDSPETLRVGQELVIPGGRPPAPPTPVLPTPEPTPVAETMAAPAPVDAAAATKGQEIVNIAMQYVGYPYVSGGTSPATGFDCSGFTQFVYAQAGISIPRGLSGQVAAGPAVSQDALMPGDLVFFQNTWGAGLSHASIYIGDGRFVHASSPERGVCVDELSLPYWSQRYYAACRPW